MVKQSPDAIKAGRTDDDHRKGSSVVASATLALVADPWDHHSLVDLPLGPGFVAGFGLDKVSVNK
jgi:hypothetical protein